ncbi:MAG TPA: hypothetical protein VF432_06260 [Thermoanaerobaculia bacterium]
MTDIYAELHRDVPGRTCEWSWRESLSQHIHKLHPQRNKRAKRRHDAW